MASPGPNHHRRQAARPSPDLRPGRTNNGRRRIFVKDSQVCTDRYTHSNELDELRCNRKQRPCASGCEWAIQLFSIIE